MTRRRKATGNSTLHLQGEEQIWTLTDDQRNLYLTIPHLRLAGMAEPLNLVLEFDAATLNEVIARLTVLRSQMPPLPLAPWKRR